MAADPFDFRYDPFPEAAAREAKRPDVVVKPFLRQYYETFDADRGAVAGLYREGSMLSIEGNDYLGAAEIGRQLGALRQSKSTMAPIFDAQPLGAGYLVFVKGSMSVDGREEPLNFTQVFHLLPVDGGSFYVQNDIFRINYG